MKIKSKLFYFLLGIMISGTAVYAATKITADNIYYTDSNNQEITVDKALNNLYTGLANYRLNINDLTTTTAWSAGIRLQPRKADIELGPGQYLVFAVAHNLAQSDNLIEANNITTNLPTISGDNNECQSINEIRQQSPASLPISNKYNVVYTYENIFLCNITNTKTLTVTGSNSNTESEYYTSSVSVQAVKIK